MKMEFIFCWNKLIQGNFQTADNLTLPFSFNAPIHCLRAEELSQNSSIETGDTEFYSTDWESKEFAELLVYRQIINDK